MGKVVAFRTDGRLSEATRRDEAHMELISALDEAEDFYAKGLPVVREWEGNMVRGWQRVREARAQILALQGGGSDAS